MTPAPANGKEVKAVDFIIWLLEAVAEAAICYGVGKVLDFIIKHR